jgi:hypothetical protein
MKTVTSLHLLSKIWEISYGENCENNIRKLSEQKLKFSQYSCEVHAALHGWTFFAILFIRNSKLSAAYTFFYCSFKKLSSDDLTSKKILLITPSSYISHLFEPCLVDKMVQYFIDRKNIVSAYSTIQLLKYTYSFGYTPAKCDEFIDVASQVIVRWIYSICYFSLISKIRVSVRLTRTDYFHRERNELSAYYLIFGALSLCYYDHFPRQLSEYIFNVEFLEYIDSEIPSMMKVSLLFFSLADCLFRIKF